MTDIFEQPQNRAAIDFLRTRSLTNVVQSELQRMILDGELKPNERVNENSLSQRLGVSRGPIREACSALAALGLMEVIPNRGFFIRSLTDEEAQEVSEARASVFGSMAMLLAERITDAQIATLRALLQRMEEIVEVGDPHIYYPVNLEFHHQIALMCGNKRLALIYQSFVNELHIQRFRTLSTPDVLKTSNEEHMLIFEKLEARQPMGAFLAAQAHVMNGVIRRTVAASKDDALKG
jgi:DNA-binding GntR family transcriptional regulator